LDYLDFIDTIQSIADGVLFGRPTRFWASASR
jgi:hypothetical protein